jgi:uncharacterized protein (TIGR03437 family)
VVLDPPSGDFFTSADVEIGVDSTGLAVGDYSATISFNEEGHSGPPATVALALSVKPAVQEGDSPSLSTAGIVSSANFGVPAMAPGGLFTIFGFHLATTTAEASSTPLPTNLGGTEVVVNGRLAPLMYVSPSQINAQFPVDAEFGRGGVIVRTGLGQSLTIFMESTQAAPQIFTDGGRVIAINQDGTLNSATNPARGGSLLTLFLTGQGPVDPPVPSGLPGPTNPLAEVTLTATAEIGGRQVEIPFLGLAPGFVGLAQANLQVPTGLSGDLPVRLTIGDVVSNTLSSRSWSSEMKKLALCFAFCLLVAAPLWANSVLRVDFGQLSTLAERVVAGRITKVSAAEDPRNGYIYSTVTLAVSQAVPEQLAGREYSFRMIGGELNGRVQYIADYPKLRVGNDVVLFLNANTSGVFGPTVGLGQGVFYLQSSQFDGVQRVMDRFGRPSSAFANRG